MWGLTSRVLLDVARTAYGQEPEMDVISTVSISSTTLISTFSKYANVARSARRT